ncbi:cobalamin biosynthesis protein [Yinghuangia seranimata]|uniref:cobalamin biosynthesis protein n=1 Tax=Yinghuangia seranimata TaxID=408067 RepID=UPI00248D3A67|nr:cobalamin biosynthesis protein [Yinghuangia seranimata]MDI2126704.1 cobalamin biosynthesis protein [Yinghuangia seranimata]
MGRPVVTVADGPGRPLVVGVGASRGVSYDELADTLAAALAAAALEASAVGTVATLDGKRGEPGIHALAEALGAELVWLPAEVLANVPVPTPSDVVRAAVGTPSVAEAAALAAARGGDLLIRKTLSDRTPSLCTIAVACHRVGGTGTR